MASERFDILPRRAFSLIEMMAVLAILAILLALGVPAIKSMIYSSERSLAENQLRVAMTAARDAAVRSGGGDAAAVFFYADGRTSIIPCVSVGMINDSVHQGATLSASVLEREVFVPVEGIEPIRLPQGWNVRGYAAPGVIATGPAAVDNPDGLFDCASMPLTIAEAGHWVFPETDFIDWDGLRTNAQGYDEGWKRQTFLVRFEAGTGNASISERRPVIVLDPLPVTSDSGFRSRVPYNLPENDVTQAATLESFVKQSVSKPILLTQAAGSTILSKLIGDMSPDTVLALPVTEVALYDEQRMAGAIGAARLNQTTKCLYGDPADRTIIPIEPTIDTSLFAGVAVDEIQERIDAYMTRNVSNTLPDNTVSMEARVFTVQRYMGQMQEVSPEVEE